MTSEEEMGIRKPPGRDKIAEREVVQVVCRCAVRESFAILCTGGEGRRSTDAGWIDG